MVEAIFGALLLLVGTGFEDARHSAAIEREHSQAQWQIYWHSSDVYLTEGFIFQGEANAEMQTFGTTSRYWSLREQAREQLDLSASHRAAAMESLGSANSSGDRERLYKSVSIGCFVGGSVLIVDSVIRQIVRSHKIAENIKIRPTRNGHGGLLAYNYNF